MRWERPGVPGERPERQLPTCSTRGHGGEVSGQRLDEGLTRLTAPALASELSLGDRGKWVSVAHKPSVLWSFVTAAQTKTSTNSPTPRRCPASQSILTVSACPTHTEALSASRLPPFRPQRPSWASHTPDRLDLNQRFPGLPPRI